MSRRRSILLAALCLPVADGTRFLIVRHGETNHNALGIIQGSSDVSRLTDRGVNQARVAGYALASLDDVSINRVFVSSLTRARQTLDTIEKAFSTALPQATVLADLREIDLGSWESRDKADLTKEHPDMYAAWKRDPLKFYVDEERPVVNLWARAADAWAIMREQPKEQPDRGTATGGESIGPVTLVVTHNACGQALLCTSLGLDETHFRQFEFGNCAALEIDWPHDAKRARAYRWRIGPKMASLVRWPSGSEPPWVEC